MSSERVNELLEVVAERENDLYGKDFLLTWDHQLNDLSNVLDVAEALRLMRGANISARCFDSGLAVSIFRDKSTRTRFSFASAANLLGLAVQDLDETKSQIAHGETVRETAIMISFLTEVIGIRDDMYLGAGHTYMHEVAGGAGRGAPRRASSPRAGASSTCSATSTTPPRAWPTCCTCAQTSARWRILTGKKLAMSWAYSPSYGKPLSVPQGIIGLMTPLRHARGPGPSRGLRSDAGGGRTRPAPTPTPRGGSSPSPTTWPRPSRDADIVYPKSWAPYAVMERRTELLRARRPGRVSPSSSARAWPPTPSTPTGSATEALMDRTKDGKALYLHCLPADITGVSCERGEVAAEVFDQYRDTPTARPATSPT